MLVRLTNFAKKCLKALWPWICDRSNFFAIVSLAMASVFGWGFFEVAGVPPVDLSEAWLQLLVFMFFLMLPFAKKVDLFQLFSFEAKIDEVKKTLGETKDKVSDVRDDVRHIIQQQYALSQSVHSNNTHTTHIYNGPSPGQTAEALDEIKDVPPADVFDRIDTKSFIVRDSSEVDDGHSKGGEEAAERDRNEEANVKSKPQTEAGWDTPFSAIKRRNDAIFLRHLSNRMSHDLRALVAKAGLNEVYADPLKFDEEELIYVLAASYPEIAEHQTSFDVFFQIAKSFFAGKSVPPKDTQTAIYLGKRLLTVLDEVSAAPPVST